MLKNLQLLNYRNYVDEKIDFDSKTNVLTGTNGQGKTNILEAVYFLSMLRSFRTASPREIRGIGSDFFHVSAFLNTSRGYDKLLEVDYAETRRLRIDSSPVFKASEFIGSFKAVAFLPSDLMIVTEGAALRRRFVNMFLCSYDKIYLADLNDYANALKSRNALLKNQNPDTDALTAFERILAEKAVAITAKRAAVLKKISEEMARLFREIKGGNALFNIAYTPHPSTENIEAHAAKLAADRAKDAARRSTSLGPHLDDCQFLLNDKPLRAFGSTGQCRLAALCLKLAALKLLGDIDGGGAGTVALVDDVAGELDSETQDAFFGIVSQTEQSFFTFTATPSDAYFADAKILEVKNGSISNAAGAAI
ncbi:MAG: DNA replication and repair protein RecF [Kiritimatiellaeota bacterium]|nr:DNA replication and repair protein RecF [Kiritimatiellota bacterium]